jgi:hypothetical protein
LLRTARYDGDRLCQALQPPNTRINSLLLFEPLEGLYNALQEL